MRGKGRTGDFILDKLTGISSFRGFIDETDKLLADNPNDNFDILYGILCSLKLSMICMEWKQETGF